MATEPAVEDVGRLQRSARDVSTLPDVMSRWLSTVMPGGASPQVTVESGVDSNGMSSETIILTGRWDADGEQHEEKWVARVAPSRRRRAGVLVVPDGPPVRRDPAGRREDRRARAASAVAGADRHRAGHAVLPDGLRVRRGAARRDALHVRRTTGSPTRPRSRGASCRTTPSTCWRSCIRSRRPRPPSGSWPTVDEANALRRNLNWLKSWYEFAVPDIGRSPLVEQALAWLEANWPDDVAATQPVLVWGDSRVGNVLYEDFKPVAVLDWEMATLGPREMDAAWMIFAHMVFQELAGLAGMPGLPDFMREDDVKATYAEAHRCRAGRPELVLHLLRGDLVLRVHADQCPSRPLRRDREARRRRNAVLSRRPAAAPHRR